MEPLLPPQGEVPEWSEGDGGQAVTLPDSASLSFPSLREGER